MATRRRANPTGENAVGGIVQRGESDVDLRVVRNGRVFVVKEQTIQLVKFHPISVRVGMESDLPPNATPEQSQSIMQMMADEVDYRLNTELKSHVEAGVQVLEELGRRPVV